jgi:hypothetical protein
MDSSDDPPFQIVGIRIGRSRRECENPRLVVYRYRPYRPTIVMIVASVVRRITHLIRTIVSSVVVELQESKHRASD